MSRLDQFEEFVSETAPRLLRRWGSILEQVNEDFPGADIPGLTLPASGAYRLADLLAQSSEDEELEQSLPFTGGQCDAVYDIEWTATSIGNPPDCSTTNTPNQGTIQGPFRLVTGEPEPGQPGTRGDYFEDRDGNRVALVTFAESEDCDYFGSRITSVDSVSIQGQDPDDCGDPDPEYDEDVTVDPVELDDDGEISGPNLPTLPEGWRPRLCGIDLELPCPGISICAGGFRGRIGPCGVEVDLDPRGLPGAGEGVENDSESEIEILDLGEGEDGEVDVPDDTESVYIEAVGQVDPAVRLVHTAINPDRVERWLGFVSTGAPTTAGGTAYSANLPLSYGRNLYVLPTALEDRTVKVRSQAGVQWRISDTGERTNKYGRECPCLD